MWQDWTSPISPARTASRIQERCGAHRPFWLTARTTPFSSARSASRAPASRSSTKGFCDSTCFPASSAVSISASRSAGCGVRSTTAISSRVSVRCDVVRRLGVGKELVAPRLGLGERPAADHRHVEARRPIRVEMRRRDAARSDQRDARPIVLRHRRPVGQVGRRDLGGRRALQGVGVEVRRLGHATSATVRFVSAESTALSTIRCPIEAKRRVERPGDRRAVVDAREHVFDRRAPARAAACRPAPASAPAPRASAW